MFEKVDSLQLFF